MSAERERPKAGEQVILLAIPPGLLDLPEEDQRAIAAMVGKLVTLAGYDEDGRAELDFDDPFEDNSTHTIWVALEFVAGTQD